eukprot:1684154-Pyramimonas_sp.AAC.1
MTASHGCAHRLKERKGNVIKKPWVIASTSNIVTSGLERRRDGAHARVEARGMACKLAEAYTDEFAKRQTLGLLAALSPEMNTKG